MAVWSAMVRILDSETMDLPYTGLPPIWSPYVLGYGWATAYGTIPLNINIHNN